MSRVASCEPVSPCFTSGCSHFAAHSAIVGMGLGSARPAARAFGMAAWLRPWPGLRRDGRGIRSSRPQLSRALCPTGYQHAAGWSWSCLHARRTSASPALLPASLGSYRSAQLGPGCPSHPRRYPCGRSAVNSRAVCRVRHPVCWSWHGRYVGGPSLTGRTSTVPARATAPRAAMAIASSRSLTSMSM